MVVSVAEAFVLVPDAPDPDVVVVVVVAPAAKDEEPADPILLLLLSRSFFHGILS